MAINELAVSRHGREIEYRDLIVFDDVRRRACASAAFGFYTCATLDQYRYHDGLTAEEWKRIVHTLGDGNPHCETESKGEAMRRVERTKP